MEFEVGQRVEFSEGAFEIKEKIPANPGYFNYVLKSDAGNTRKIGGTILNKFVENEKNRKLLTGVPFSKYIQKKRNSKLLNLPQEPEVDASETELYFSLGYYARYGTLNIRTVPDTDRKIKGDYLKVTGEILEGHVLDETPSTWGNKMFFEFPRIEPELKEKLFVPPNTESETWVGDKFYNNNWIWTLITDFGFRIGRQDVELIKSHIYSENNIEDFMKGYNYGR